MAVLALKVGTYCVAACALAAMIKRWRDTYVLYRELLSMGMALLGPLVVQSGCLYGLTQIMRYHNGSAVLLLSLIAISNGTWTLMQMALWAPHTRQYRTGLPLVVLLMLLRGGSICRRAVLDVPDFVVLLRNLRWGLSFAHSPVSWAVMIAEEMGPPGGSDHPMQQCLAINTWCTVTFGLLLPCTIQSWLEGRLHSRPPAEPSALAQEGEGRAAARGMRLFLSSCMVWSIVTTASPLLLRLYE